MALKDFEALAAVVWSAPATDKLDHMLNMIELTVSSKQKKQSLRQQAQAIAITKLDQFAANMMLFKGDPVVKIY